MALLINSNQWAGIFSRIPRAIAPLLLLVLAGSCVKTASVIQGKVVSVDPGGAVIRVADETKPEGTALAIDITKAEIGNPPQPGDLVRIVYKTEGSANVALRVMNLTRQKERGGH
jgi:hypothetical protein